MSFRTFVCDPKTERSARVTNRDALQVSVTDQPAPEAGTENVFRAFTHIIDGMNVDGSGTPQTFKLQSEVEYDILIKAIMILTVDGSITANKFGAVLALTNGVDMIFRESGDDSYLIEKAKTTGDMILQVGFDELPILPSFLRQRSPHHTSAVTELILIIWPAFQHLGT